jgi:hypothetical protein
MSKFAKPHYEVIAEAMQEAHPGSQVLFDNVDNECFRTAAAAWQIACTELANKFARDNGQFNRERFIAACQPEANVRARTQYRITGVA